MPDLTQSQMDRLRRKLAGRHKSTLESTSDSTVSLDEAKIRDRTEQSRDEIMKRLEKYFGKDDRRKEIVDQIEPVMSTMEPSNE